MAKGVARIRARGITCEIGQDSDRNRFATRNPHDGAERKSPQEPERESSSSLTFVDLPVGRSVSVMLIRLPSSLGAAWQIDVMGGVRLSDGTQLSVVTGVDDHSRFCVIARLVERATARPVCDALMAGLSRWGVPDQILTDNAKVFTGRLAQKPAVVLFDRICLNNGIRHILTAPYSPTTTGKVERLHKTLRKELFAETTFDSIVEAQAGLDDWVAYYNYDRDHQGIGDVPPIRRFEIADRSTVEVVDGEMEITEEQESKPAPVVRRVDSAGRISILKHRYHVGRYLAGQAVTVESSDGLLHVSHNGVVVATHARRHLPEDDTQMDRRAKPSRPKPATLGSEVLRIVDSSGGISFAGTGYRVGNGYRGQTVGVRIVADTVQVSQDGILIRTHRACHDPAKEHGALARPNGKPLRNRK